METTHTPPFVPADPTGRPPQRRRWTHALTAIAVVAALGLAGCSKPATVTASNRGHDSTVALPRRVALVAPTGWHGDLSKLIDPTIASVTVLAVDAHGTTTEVTSVDLTGGGATNDALAKANRAIAIHKLATTTIPAGTGYGDLLAGARAALETQSDPIRVVTLATGCLDIAGQRLTGADLSTPTAINTATTRITNTGILQLPATPGDLLLLAGTNTCTTNSIDATARQTLTQHLCTHTTLPCTTRQTNTTR